MITIKFRGYSDELKSFVYGFYQEVNVNGVVYSYIFWQGNTTPVITGSVSKFTGLKDKNGKEIYECEILYNNDREEHCIVKYSKEKAMFIVKYLESNDEFPLWQSISNLYYSVGNIYENPELLEKKFAN
jgi:uncharacterized phage protein (TIGR01671 family)